jgi:hypothetical protein
VGSVNEEKVMSLKTWKAEFYPRLAHDCKTGLEAVHHSLQKWKGLKRSALAKHGVRREEDGYLVDNNTDYEGALSLDDDTCALCHVFYDADSFRDEHCDKCPLKIETGRRCADDDSIYQRYITTGRGAKQMVAVLKKIRDTYDL